MTRVSRLDKVFFRWMRHARCLPHPRTDEELHQAVTTLRARRARRDTWRAAFVRAHRVAKARWRRSELEAKEARAAGNPRAYFT